MKIEKGEDSAFISEAADCLTPFGGPVKFKKFDESPALVVQYATLVSSVSSSSYEDECTLGSTTSSLSSNSSSDSSSISTSSISSRSSDFEYLA